MSDYEFWETVRDLTEAEERSIQGLKYSEGGRALVKWLRYEQERVYKNWLKVNPQDENAMGVVNGFQGTSQAYLRVLTKLTENELIVEEPND